MKILNFGSLNIDCVYEVKNIVNPGETVSSLSRKIFAGGKGLNQSVALARAGARVYHAGCIGTEGVFLKDLLLSSGVDVSCVYTVSEPTGHAVIQVEHSGQNSIVLFGGANQCITENQIEAALNNFSKGDWILLQNEINNLDIIIDKAYKNGLNIALNPSPLNDKIISLDLNKVTCFIMNEIEGYGLTGESDPQKIIAEMQKKYPDATVILTLGQNGSIYSKNGLIIRQPIFECDVVDTTGAGDTFTGFVLAGMMSCQPPEQFMQTASKAAAIAVSRHGASDSVPTLDEVNNF